MAKEQQTMRTKQEIQAYLKELEEVYAKAASAPDSGKKPAHMIVLARVIKDKIDILRWVLGGDKP
jgi:hypothetical protein